MRKQETMPTTPMKREKKELCIFLLIAFGVPFVMGIPLAVLSHTGSFTTPFAAVQMLYPAAGLILAKLICDNDKSLMPRPFFISFLCLTTIMFVWCFTPFFLPSKTVAEGSGFVTIAGAIIVAILLFLENDKKKLDTYGLTGKNWRLSIRLLLLFVVLYYAAVLLSSVAEGSLAELLSGFSFSHLLSVFWELPLSFLFSLPLVLGEEYGWRVYFQPLLQKKFGLIKGVFVFGVLWGLWHLPLTLFFYAPGASAEALAQSLVLRLITGSCLAIFLAYTYMRTQNVWLPTLIHFLNNSFASVGAFDQEMSWGLLGIFGLIHMALFFPFLRSKVFRTQEDDDSQECRMKDGVI